MAAARRVTCLLILLLGIASWVSSAQTSQGGVPDSNHTISTGKGLFLEGEAAATAATSKNRVGGRKMVTKRQGKGKGKGKQSSVSHIFSSEHEVDDSRFVAFNADYHAPRHHPPKNN